MPEENTNVEMTAQVETTETADVEVSVDEQIRTLNEQNQQLMNEIAKLKKASDKNASEAAKYKRQYRETLSAQEQASQDKAEKEAEREAYIQSIVRENQMNKYVRQYMSLGYSAELAEKAATARADGDEDALLKIQQDAQTAIINAERAKWLKSRPDVSTGTTTTVTTEQFANMGIIERSKLKRESPDTYAQLARKS